jgi:hypothetical protein
MAMEFTLTAPEAGKTVADVVFFDNADPSLTHARQVNAVFDAEGVYDEQATIARVGDVMLGVVHKLDVGAITLSAPVEEEEAPAE